MPRIFIALVSGIPLIGVALILAVVVASTSLASPLLHRLHFSAISGSELENRISGQSFPEKIDTANPDMADTPQFFYPEYFSAEYDLDADGTNEIFVYVSGVGMCGSHGCALRIYKLTSNNQWLNVLGMPNGEVSSTLQVCILDSKVDGYFNIGLNCAKNSEFPTWKWNGYHYSRTTERQSLNPKEKHPASSSNL